MVYCYGMLYINQIPGRQETSSKNYLYIRQQGEAEGEAIVDKNTIKKYSEIGEEWRNEEIVHSYLNILEIKL